MLANSVDPIEMDHKELSNQDLICLPFCFLFYTETPIRISGQVQIK